MKVFVKLILIFLIAGCAKETIPYNLKNPTKTVSLPPELNEISGLSDFDNDYVVAVQDEQGIAYLVNIDDGNIERAIKFDGGGDFEGLTYHDSNLYILRSDGRLSAWENFLSGDTVQHFTNYTLNLDTRDNEGLGYDPLNHSLLIAAKSKPLGEFDKNVRVIYGFDLELKKIAIDPALIIDLDELEQVALKFGVTQQNVNLKGKIKPFNFRPSSIAVHPESSEYYVLSAEEFMLVVIGRDGKIRFVTALEPSLFTKAEGITFLPNGNMVITNEALGGKATLLLFNKVN